MHNFQLTVVFLALFTFSSSFGYRSEHPHRKPKHSNRSSPTTTMTTDSTSTSFMTTDSTPSETESTSDTSTEESTQISDFTESSTESSTTAKIFLKDNEISKPENSNTLLISVYGIVITLAILVALIYCIRRHYGSYSVKEQCKPIESTAYFNNIKY
uniref:Gustav n=1 Tax=Drosophila melanogaster TaxID=7227 RepID=Q962F3_DROME|nr:Gustav [Drosophila melanogaster]